MSATSTALGIPSKFEPQPSGGTSYDLNESAGKWGLGNVVDVDITPRPAPSAPLTRNWTSLQEHADTVRAAIPGGGGSTPRPEDRREGYTWEVPKGDELNDQSRRRVFSKGAAPPPIITRDNSGDDAPTFGATLTTEVDHFNAPYSKRRTSTGFSSTSTFGQGSSRRDTGWSSFSSGSIAKGLMRHVPDIIMFTPDKQKFRKTEEHGGLPPRPSKSGRTLSFISPTAPKKTISDEKVPKHVHLDPLGLETTAPSPIKGGVKARRNINQAEAMKLTLPLQLPNLPSRRRISVATNATLQELAPRRPRSPKTPWIRDTPLSWELMPDVPPIILEGPSPSLHFGSNTGGHGLLPGSDLITSSMSPSFNERPIRIRKYINRPRYKEGSSYNSERTISSLGAFASADIQTRPVDRPRQPPPIHQEELQEVSKQPRRWRWSSPFSSSDAHSGESLSHKHDTINAIDRRCSFSSLFCAKRKSTGHNTQTPVSPFTEANNERIVPWHLTQTPNHKYGTALALANMTVPPSFVPPGLKRVPTPPILDERGEVKETLADFVFEMDHMPRPKRSPGLPGGVWDSDAILMPQASDITLHSSDEEESPQAPLTPLQDSVRLTPNTGYVGDNPWAATLSPNASLPLRSPGLPQTPSSLSDHEEWFRVPRDADSNFDTGASPGEEERAKFEWLTPEHLPNSPLCPLHVKYRGSSKGMCVFHGRAKGPGMRLSNGGGLGSQADGQNPAWEGDEKRWAKGFLAHRRRISMSSA